MTALMRFKQSWRILPNKLYESTKTKQQQKQQQYINNKTNRNETMYIPSRAHIGLNDYW